MSNGKSEIFFKDVWTCSVSKTPTLLTGAINVLKIPGARKRNSKDIFILPSVLFFSRIIYRGKLFRFSTRK